MLTVISPAKSLDMSPVTETPTAPMFQADAVRLSKTARNLTLGGLRDLMSISDDLARLKRPAVVARSMRIGGIRLRSR